MGSKWLCLDCGTVFDGDYINTETDGYYAVCPISGCNGNIAEIDELILPAIKILNEKCYLTEFCCSGHWYDGSYPYIKFLDDIELPSLPDGWRADEDKFLSLSVCIRPYKIDKDEHCLGPSESVEHYLWILDSIKNLIKWAEELAPAYEEYPGNFA